MRIQGNVRIVTGSASGKGRTAVFIASSDSDYITGQTIMVDGGTNKLR